MVKVAPSSGATSASDTSSNSTNNGGSTNQSGKPSNAPPYTATTQKISEAGHIIVDVDLPQVQGGNEAVAQIFNDAMQSALQAQVNNLPAGKLKSDSKSGVRIGARVLSGLLHTTYTPGNATQSISKASSVVVEISTSSILDVASIFTDMTAGLKRLQSVSQRLGSTSSAGDKFTGTNLQADKTTFSNWTAQTDGMKVYFAQGTVAPSTQGVVELTLPWTDLQDVLKPGVLEVVSS